MPQPGDIVIVDFVGAAAIKKRPGVVVSSDLYHAHRPDIIVAILTTKLSAATAPTDYILQDSSHAGLHQPSAFRVYLGTYHPGNVSVVGHLSDRDWRGVQSALARALAIPTAGS